MTSDSRAGRRFVPQPSLPPLLLRCRPLDVSRFLMPSPADDAAPDCFRRDDRLCEALLCSPCFGAYFLPPL